MAAAHRYYGVTIRETVELDKYLWKQHFEIIQLAVWVAGATPIEHMTTAVFPAKYRARPREPTGEQVAQAPFRCAFISQHLLENLAKKIPHYQII